MEKRYTDICEATCNGALQPVTVKDAGMKKPGIKRISN